MSTRKPHQPVTTFIRAGQLTTTANKGQAICLSGAWGNLISVAHGPAGYSTLRVRTAHGSPVVNIPDKTSMELRL
jgi:hypothetical protein